MARKPITALGRARAKAKAVPKAARAKVIRPPWKLAASLERLRAQINALAPQRMKASDGTIGDAAHAHTRSDHNPYDYTPRIPNDLDVVNAMDITHDPAGGVDCHILAQSLVDSRDGRIQYIIWNRRIVNREVSPWVWRPYNGANPHDKHIHISVDEKPELYDDDDDWSFRLTATVAPRPAPRPIPPPPAAPEGRVDTPIAGGIAGAGAAGLVAAQTGDWWWWVIAGIVVVVGIVIAMRRAKK